MLENVIYVNLGRMYSALDQYHVALEYLLIAQRNEHILEPSYTMVLYIFLSDLYLQLKDYSFAIYYGEKVLTPENIQAKPFPMAINYHNIALAQIELKQFELAQANLNLAKNLAKQCSNAYATAYNYLAQANLHHATNQIDKADACFQSAITNMAVTGVNSTIIEVHQEYAAFLIEQKRYEEALTHLNFESGGKKTQDHSVNHIDHYHQLFTCYKNLDKVNSHTSKQSRSTTLFWQ